MTDAIQYAVSRGNGNDGVSRLYPKYLVTTNEPWLLAKLAAVTEFKAGRGRKWCRDNLMIDGEPEYTLSATLLDPPGRDGAGYSDGNGAWLTWEIFPAYGTVSDQSEAPTYDSLDECFGKRAVATERKLDK